MGISVAAVSITAVADRPNLTCKQWEAFTSNLTAVDVALQDLTAGTFAGAASLVVGHPFDTIKVMIVT